MTNNVRIVTFQVTSKTSESIEIGAMSTMTTLAESALFGDAYAALKQAAIGIGSVQIRNAATIGGNIANASPASDIAPVLSVLGAEAVIADAEGFTRRSTIDNLLIGLGKTSLKHNEAIVRFIIPKTQIQKSAFVKLGYRKTQTISRIGLAITLEFDQSGFIASAGVVAGAIAPVPVHVKKAEQYLIGKNPGPQAAAAIGEILSELIMKITPKEFDRDYKARAAFGITDDIMKIIKPGQETH